MRTKNFLRCCAALLAVGWLTESHAQPSLREPALSPDEQAELVQLLTRFVPNSPPPNDLPLMRQRWLLNQLREYLVVASPLTEGERLVVCETSGDPHLKKDDVIYLSRVGSSGSMRMRVVRGEGTSNQTYPWKSSAGNVDFIVDASITGKKHGNPAFKKFTPEGVGIARVEDHSGSPPEDHPFTMRRNTRVSVTPGCTGLPGDEDLLIYVPEHATGGRHGGHAVAN
jgi:hypothetical protein